MTDDDDGHIGIDFLILRTFNVMKSDDFVQADAEIS